MRYGWNEAKRKLNIRKHGIDFTTVHSFTWNASIRWVDDREDYGELREVATGFIGADLHFLVFTERDDEDGSYIWIISLRKATKREQDDYARQTKIRR